MIVQHNLPAMNSHRNLGINNKFTSKNLEKLSSGYRINRAADDAAGLAISEKMRGQIRGLGMAEQNTSHGINLIQTAEGGLNETHAILQRMRELAVQSSNGTYQDVDRDQLTKEFEALKSEVNRIAESIHYNGIKLLDGSLSESYQGSIGSDNFGMVNSYSLINGIKDGSIITMTTASYAASNISQAETQATNVTAVVAPGAMTAGGKISFDIDGKTYSTTIATTDIGTAGAFAQAILRAIEEGGGSDKWKASASAGGAITFTSLEFGEAAGEAAVKGLTVSNWKATNGSGAAVSDATFVTPATYTAGKDRITDPPEVSITRLIDGAASETLVGVYNWNADAFSFQDSFGNTFTLDASVIRGNGQVASLIVNSGKNLTFQIGANGGQDQRVNLGVDNMSAANLGLYAGDIKSNGVGATTAEAEMLATAGINTIESANKAIEIIHAATNQVSGQRAELGALQNRLESTMNSLGITKENLTAAESTIRDVDMAKEMMEFTKNNILVQASQAMLAQANQLPQGVLQLLR